MRDIEHWREQRGSADRQRPWWLWPVSLLWRRQPVVEQDTVPVPVPKFVDTMPTDRSPL